MCNLAEFGRSRSKIRALWDTPKIDPSNSIIPPITFTTVGLYRTVSEINGDFSRKIKIKFFPPSVFNAPAEGVPRGIGYRPTDALSQK